MSQVETSGRVSGKTLGARSFETSPSKTDALTNCGIKLSNVMQLFLVGSVSPFFFRLFAER